MKRFLLIVALSLPLAGYCGESASETAKAQIEKEDQDARVSEAKELIREREQVMLRLNEIILRIAELDKGAKAKQRTSCANCAYLTVSGSTTSNILRTQ